MMLFSSVRKKIPLLLILSVLLTFSMPSKGQSHYESLNHQLLNFNAFNLNLTEDSAVRTNALYPRLNSDLSGGEGLNYRSYAPVDRYDSSVFVNRKFKEYGWIRRKLLYENFILIDTGLLHISIDPLFNLSKGQEKYINQLGGNEKEPKSLYMNTRGIMIKGSIGEKLAFESYFYENQAAFPYYVEDFVNSTEVVPGQGRVKNFKENAFDFAQSGGYVSYEPGKAFNVQFGHHKLFIGDGYRSMILSDNSFNYPFLRMNAWFCKNKLSYSVIYAWMQDLDRLQTNINSEAIFKRKGASYHFLEYRFNKYVSANITQGIIWPLVNEDGKLEFKADMYNPIMFTYPMFEGMEGENNVIFGGGIKVSPMRRLEIYGQYVVDDAKFEKTAYQAGAKVLLMKQFVIQVEGNHADKNTYASSSDQLENSFTHYNQALAHTLGDEFDEFIVKMAYRYKRLIPDLQVNYINQFYKVPEPAPAGNINIYTLQEYKLIWTKFELAYVLNPATNLKLFTSYTYRWGNGNINNESVITNFFYLGIKTDLRNLYYDF